MKYWKCDGQPYCCTNCLNRCVHHILEIRYVVQQIVGVCHCGKVKGVSRCGRVRFLDDLHFQIMNVLKHRQERLVDGEPVDRCFVVLRITNHVGLTNLSKRYFYRGSCIVARF